MPAARAVYVDDAGIAHDASLYLSTTAAVPALNIPSSTISVLVASGNGSRVQDVTLQVCCAALAGSGQARWAGRRLTRSTALHTVRSGTPR